MSEYDYEYEYDEQYCYPGTSTLRNKLGITDQNKLDAIERDLTAIRTLQLEQNPINGNFDLKHLKGIHRFIFGDIFEWAGSLRTVNISKGVLFCRSDYLEDNCNDLFRKLSKEHFEEMNYEKFVSTLAHYLGEINAMHPFREGNGRAQRAFINQLAMKYGYYLDFSKISEEEMIEASYHSFSVDDTKMITLIYSIIIKK